MSRKAAGASALLLAALVYSLDDGAAGAGAQSAPVTSPATAKPSSATRSASTAKPSSTVYRDVYNGYKWWHVYCARCHGENAMGAVNAPNLIGQNQKLTRAEFMRIVREGRPDKGMQSWKELLDNAQIGQIYLYVRARKEKVLRAGRPDEVGPNRGPWVPPSGWPPK